MMNSCDTCCCHLLHSVKKCDNLFNLLHFSCSYQNERLGTKFGRNCSFLGRSPFLNDKIQQSSKPVLKKELYASRIRGISQSSYITIRIEQLADDLHNVFFSIQARRRLVCHSTKASHQGTNNFGDFCTMCVSSYNLGIFSFWLMLLGHIQNFVTQK